MVDGKIDITVPAEGNGIAAEEGRCRNVDGNDLVPEKVRVRGTEKEGGRDCCPVARSSLALCNLDCSTPGSSVLLCPLVLRVCSNSYPFSW